MTKPKLQLTDLQERTFLLDIENLDAPIDLLNLDNILDRNPALYGPKGSELRKRMSTYFYNLRRKSIRNYVKQLERYEIPISDATRRRYDQEYRLPHENGAGEEEIETMGALMKEKPSFKAQTKTSQQAMTIAASVPSSSSWSFTPSRAESENFLGSKLNPRIIHVTTDFPERNFPFEVVDVNQFEANGYHVQAISICIAVHVGDHDNCHAWMEEDSSELRSSSILITLPSRNKVLNQVVHCHRHDPDSGLAKAHLRAKRAVDHDSARGQLWWRLVFPDGYVLDNGILSGRSNDIERKVSGITWEHQIAGVSKEFQSFCVSWTVAKASTAYLKPKEEKQLTYDDVFA